MKALVFERKVARFAASRVAAALAGSGRGVGVGPLQLTDVELPRPPAGGKGWHVVRPILSGICGSDIATLDGHSSRYFEEIVSFPFVPGHEVVGTVEGGPLDGKRVVLEPVLGCVARGIEPPCPACQESRRGSCGQLSFGHLKPGLQTGYCADTGGGWSNGFIAHESQLHEVPVGWSDDAAVMVEPVACAIHAALSPGVAELDNARVVVLGAGTLGLGVIAALERFTAPADLLAVAKHPEQRRTARALGATTVVEPAEMRRAVRRQSGGMAISSEGDPGRVRRLAGAGADIVYDCVGSASSLEESLGVTRPGGRIVLVGMPGAVRIDLAPLWQREISLTGAYAYGTEDVPATAGNGAARRSTFDMAFELVEAAGLDRLVSARYPLDCFEEAIEHAAAAGRRGAVKVVFDLQPPRVRGSRS
jgi:threonine dehydrogenase-like Zn-dependent dehydrogenase